MTRTNIQEPMCLGDKLIVGTLEHHDEGYGLNYAGALRFPKMESHIIIYAFMNLIPQKKDLRLRLYE